MTIENSHRGLILAGGDGKRLSPISKAVSKQLLPIHDKPMIYYPIAALIEAGVREIGIVVKPDQLGLFKSYLGDGRQWGVEFSFFEQEAPRGIADGLLVSKEFVQDRKVLLILGDNVFHGLSLKKSLDSHTKKGGASFYGYWVRNPERYGVVKFDGNRVTGIVEKPETFIGNYAIPGVYFLDESGYLFATRLQPSKRGELEITQMLKTYVDADNYTFEVIPPGVAWMDTGTFDSLSQASEFVRSLQDRQGYLIGSPELSAYRQGFISKDEVMKLAFDLSSSAYGQELSRIVRES